MDLLAPSSPGGLPTLSLTTSSSWLPWGRVVMPLISPLMPVPHQHKSISTVIIEIRLLAAVNTPCLRNKVGYFYFYYNFGRGGPVFVIISVLNLERICGGRWNKKLPPPLKPGATLPCDTGYMWFERLVLVCHCQPNVDDFPSVL